MLILLIPFWVTGHHYSMDAPARILDPSPVEPQPTDSFMDAPARVLDAFPVGPPPPDSHMDAPARILDAYPDDPSSTEYFMDAPARILDAFPVEPPPTEVNDPTTASKEPEINNTETSAAEMATMSLAKAESAVTSFFRAFAENVEATMQLLYCKLREFAGFDGRSELPPSETLHGNANIQVDKSLVKIDRSGGDEVAVQPAGNYEEHQGGGDIMVASARNEELQYQRHPVRFLQKVEQLKAEFQNDPSYHDESNK
ncbi:hypothetical protein Aduo_004131 [Ancylostoma duodenale]